MIDIASIDWETVVKGLGAAVAAIAAFVQVRSLIPPSRMRLKADLEILKLLEPSSEASQLVKEHTTRTIRRIYAPSERRSKFTIYAWEDFIAGLILLPVFSIWTAYLLKDGHFWWTALTGFGAFAGFGAILNGLDPKSAKPKPDESKPKSVR
jgi:hypothetical protein